MTDQADDQRIYQQIQEICEVELPRYLAWGFGRIDAETNEDGSLVAPPLFEKLEDLGRSDPEKAGRFLYLLDQVTRHLQEMGVDPLVAIRHRLQEIEAGPRSSKKE